MLILFLLPEGAGATIRHVPADYPTIQSALDAAAASDVVLVAPGTYFENLAMKSGVILESENGADVTTIDGSSAGSVIACVGVSVSTQIRGFTLIHGSGTAQSGGTYGGAILCWNGASPLIERNTIASNAASRGGGIGCRYGSVPTIRDNEIHDNTASLWGGGFLALDAPGALITIESNEISNNHAQWGGGIYVGDADVVIQGNRMVGNSAPKDGGALWLQGLAGTKIVAWNVLWNNASILGAGAMDVEGNATVENNTFYGNMIVTGWFGTKWIRRNILAACQAVPWYCTSSGGNTFVECNDVSGNGAGDALPDCVVDLGNNFHLFPAFCSHQTGDFSLAENSPCLPGASPCGVLVGALGEGCTPVATTPTTWGSIKGRYR